MQNSSKKWLNVDFLKETVFNTVAVTDFSGVNQLAVYSATPTFSGVILGDYTKWCSNLLMFPFNLQIGDLNSELTLNAQRTGVKCQALNTTLTFGLNMGEYKYDRTTMFNDYRDFAPYTTIDVWLPFYGMVNIDPQLIAYQQVTYIQFRLYVDYHTGKAVYVIGVNDNHVEKNKEYPYSLLGVDDTHTRIISVCSFQLGQQIPLGQSGMNDVLRNAAVGGIRLATSAIPTVTTGASKQTTQTNNGTSTSTAQSSTKKTTTANTSRVINAASNALSNLQYRPHIDHVNSAQLLTSASRSIHIIFKKARVDTNEGTDYPYLYGKPLGKVVKLDTLTGYTEVNATHIEGEFFKKATSTEVEEIIKLLQSGVILPPKKEEL